MKAMLVLDLKNAWRIKKITGESVTYCRVIKNAKMHRYCIFNRIQTLGFSTYEQQEVRIIHHAISPRKLNITS